MDYNSAPQSYRYSTIENQINKRKIDDGVLMVVTASIYGHFVRTLIDSNATKSFISSVAILPLGLAAVKDYNLLELENGRKSSPKTRPLVSLWVQLILLFVWI